MKKKASGKQPYVRPQAGTFRVGSACPILVGSGPKVIPGPIVDGPVEDDEDTDLTPSGSSLRSWR